MVEAVFNSAIALLYFRHFSSAPIWDVRMRTGFNLRDRRSWNTTTRRWRVRTKSAWKNVVKKCMNAITKYYLSKSIGFYIHMLWILRLLALFNCSLKDTGEREKSCHASFRFWDSVTFCLLWYDTNPCEFPVFPSTSLTFFAWQTLVLFTGGRTYWINPHLDWIIDPHTACCQPYLVIWTLLT